MRGTMQVDPLTLGQIFKHGRRLHAASRVITEAKDGRRESTFAEVADRAELLASALANLGVQPGDRVASFCWNHQEHLELYFAVPATGAVLHTLNVRLHPDQLAYIASHAEDSVIVVDAGLWPQFNAFRHGLQGVRHVIVVDRPGIEIADADVLHYEELISTASPRKLWPDVDENDAVQLCYTSGTTGDPKGVAYSHRSVYLHSLILMSSAGFEIAERDVVLIVVPLYHAAAWGLPFAAWWAGSDMVLPENMLNGPQLARIVADLRPTVSCGVPTVWTDLLRCAREQQVDLTSLRFVLSGGSALPHSLKEGYRAAGVDLVQGWGMTETSPLAAVGRSPKDESDPEAWWRSRTGRIIPGVEIRIVDDNDEEQPWDGKCVGEIEIHGPWIAGSYLGAVGLDRFHDGWLKTGDVASIDRHGAIQITDRIKDLIKSGGEWISSVEIENTLAAHPAVERACVIGIPDDRWQERPLAVVQLGGAPREPASPGAAELRDWLAGRVAKWWIPEHWAFVGEIPLTSVGKLDKKRLRAMYSAGQLPHATLS
jgi:fatty-acyl-CoA synthase